MADQNIPNNPGANAWSGKPFSATPKNSIRKDLPDPAKNSSPKAPVPVDTYYKKYNEMMARAKGEPENPYVEAEKPEKPAIEYKDEFAEKDPDRAQQLMQKWLKTLAEDGVGLYLSEIPVDFVLSDRAFRATGIKALNGKPIFEVIYRGKVIGLAVRDAEPPKYQL